MLHVTPRSRKRVADDGSTSTSSDAKRPRFDAEAISASVAAAVAAAGVPSVQQASTPTTSSTSSDDATPIANLADPAFKQVISALRALPPAMIATLVIRSMDNFHPPVEATPTIGISPLFVTFIASIKNMAEQEAAKEKEKMEAVSAGASQRSEEHSIACDMVPCDAMRHDAMPCHAMPCDVMPILCSMHHTQERRAKEDEIKQAEEEEARQAAELARAEAAAAAARSVVPIIPVRQEA